MILLINGGATPRPRPGAVAGSNHPASQARDGGTEKQPHVQGAVAAQAQEGLEEPPHVEGQEGHSPKVRSSGCTLLEQP